MAERRSAGILLYRRPGGPAGDLEVLLAHPGGPYFAKRDLGDWTIPKGEPDNGTEKLLVAARREFEEETGTRIDPEAPMIDLGSIIQKGGKVVYGWAVKGDLDPTMARSSEFKLEWPRGSGRQVTFPEIDRVQWFDLDEARRRIKPTQVPLIDRLESALRT
jgi:predicted NUDIX family NTP pyrophosphohydrolase